MTTPFFMTHHSPVGAWASLTFGLPGCGVCIDHEKLVPETTADLLVAVHRDGVTSALPFIENPGDYSTWQIVPAESLVRTLSPCVDTFTAESAGITLRVFTPHPALPNPKRSGNLQYSTVPGILLELGIDNSHCDSPATAFIGLNLRGEVGRAGAGMRPVDWASKTLCGVGSSTNWLLAAVPVKDEVFTIQSADLAARIAAGAAEIQASATQGGIGVKVAPRSKKSIHLVMAFFHHGTATQGLEGRYLFSAYFPRVEAVANFILANSGKILESCSNFDGRAAAACPDPQKLAIFSQAVRAYEANTQLIDAAGVPYFSVIQGDHGYRNALSLAVDQLPWELYRNPWVVRNIFDLATTSYSYHDKVRFPSDSGTPDELREGGMTFAHDFGFHGAYTPTGSSAREFKGHSGPRSFRSTEELLNGIYLLTSYALLADDTPWAKTRLPFARELMTNLENRDHWDPEKRTGILKAQSDKVGTGLEATALIPLGQPLGGVPGNLYVAVKTFCANMMLTTYYQSNNDLHSADYSYAFAQKTAQSIARAFDPAAGFLPADLLAPDTSPTAVRFIAALEPLAVPTYVGLTSTLPEYFPELFAALKAHALACLKHAPEGCIDAGTGGLRLASSSPVVIPAKIVNILYVLERLFQIDVQGQFPTLWREVAAWSQVAAARGTVCDQVDCEKRSGLGYASSPRLVSTALFVKPVASGGAT